MLSCLPSLILPDWSRLFDRLRQPKQETKHGQPVYYNNGKTDSFSGSCYDHLDDPWFAIRLLELLPGTGEQRIRCRLRQVDLKRESGQYIAISYTWGEEATTEPIEINGLKIHIMKNLLDFLYRARAGDRSLMFGIDAVCIDQNNTQERNHQVQLMQRIYKKAS
jgi:Heterokaryon incompatibility protein (HET)